MTAKTMRREVMTRAMAERLQERTPMGRAAFPEPLSLHAQSARSSPTSSKASGQSFSALAQASAQLAASSARLKALRSQL